MKPAPFEYHRPSSLADALELLADLPDAEPLAGNQSLSILMSNRLASPDHLVDINDLDELSYVEADNGSVAVGALVRHREIERSGTLAQALPVFPEAAGKIAGPVVRNRGTLGGSLGEGDPAGNYPCVAAALEADLELASAGGSRTVSADEFFIATMFTDREEDELITGITVPRDPFPPARTGQTFLAVKEAAQTWPTLSVAGAVRVDDPEDEEPVLEDARVALANAAEVPLRVPGAEGEIEGEPLSEAGLAAAGETAYEAVNPEEELHADETYKRELAREYTKRALTTAHDRAVA
ncbi:MAG: carbon monoxide dehydrogenase [Halobacteriales archaeon SW_9_67_25]|jgi:carbon-monoxide dehydrogenase medium subunit|nr:MAG: carbon monoxide dehydrogenase [Halobacteriales archaeon SW_9_67_25]